MALGEAAYMCLVHDRSIPRDPSPASLLLPVEVRINDNALGHERRAVAIVKRQVVAFCTDRIAKARRIPLELADVRACVGIEQQFVWIESMSVVRIVRAVNAITVHGRRTDIGDVAMPHFVGIFR